MNMDLNSCKQSYKMVGFLEHSFFAKVKVNNLYSQEDFIHHVKLFHCAQQNYDDFDFED